MLSPEQTEGPYYIDGEKLRRDITEGRPGVPLLLRLHVVDASTCKPIIGDGDRACSVGAAESQAAHSENGPEEAAEPQQRAAAVRRRSSIARR